MENFFNKTKRAYRLTLEKSLVLTLTFLLFILHILPKNIVKKQLELEPIIVSFQIEEIPATKQTVRFGRKMPEKPVIPIESEDPDFPKDVTIDETILNWDFGHSPFGRSGLTAGVSDTIPARPLVQVLPEYPKELRKLGIKGDVKLMIWVDEKGNVEEAVVSMNSTGNTKCENSALEAVKKSKYIPATIGNKKVASWVSCIYSFKPE